MASINCLTSPQGKQEATNEKRQNLSKEASRRGLNSRLATSIFDSAVRSSNPSAPIADVLNNAVEVALSQTISLDENKKKLTPDPLGTVFPTQFNVPATTDVTLNLLKSSRFGDRNSVPFSNTSPEERDRFYKNRDAAAKREFDASIIGDFSIAQQGEGSTQTELEQFYSRSGGCNDENFILEQWISPFDTELLLSPRLIANARKLHLSIIRPVSRYFKKFIYGDEFAPVCLSVIITGIASESYHRERLGTGLMDRRTFGESVDFRINGVDDLFVAEEMLSGKIPNLEVGVFGVSSGIYASLPFSIRGQEIKGLYLYTNKGVPGHVEYKFIN